MTVRCEVPGCERGEFKSANALGPHLAWHRRMGHEGVPPESEHAIQQREKYRLAKERQRKAKKRAEKKNLPAVIPNGEVVSLADKVGKFTPRDVIDMGLLMMFPKAVKREDVYEVAQWVNHTEAVAQRALGG